MLVAPSGGGPNRRIEKFAQPKWGRTKAERLATILLPNAVAEHDTERRPMDGRAEILKQNNTRQHRPPLAETGLTEFQVRCQLAQHATVCGFRSYAA